ncbi:CAP domain-containing protein [Actinoplanes sp. NPDC051343]|uniref:CAP domain-containing protein n=1 Tax=Actinoplanes sp. NPDC051343 TaxID=3363906 RepID=UPI0037A2D2B5
MTRPRLGGCRGRSVTLTPGEGARTGRAATEPKRDRSGMRHKGSRRVRRRKPVVVVAMVAAGLLVVGGVAATRAGAEETPQWPDVPGFSLSDLPGFSGFGGDSGSGDAGSIDAPSSGAGSGDSERPADGSGDDFGGAGNGDGSGEGFSDGDGDDSGADLSGTDEAPSANRAPVVRHQSDSGNGDDSTGHDRSDSVAGSAHAVQEKPAPQKAAAVRVKPRPAMIRQDAGGSLIAEAKQNVTAADISESPSAPTQQQILALINGNRRAHGCRSVTLDRRLIEAANRHAADMARHDYFAHESRNGDGAGDRVTGAGYNWRHYGENIARGVDSAYEVVDGWMHSPEHRHNILDCSLDQMGVGLAIAGDQKRTVYWVQDFATPM